MSMSIVDRTVARCPRSRAFGWNWRVLAAAGLAVLAGHAASADMILVQWDKIMPPTPANDPNAMKRGRHAPVGAGPYKDMVDGITGTGALPDARRMFGVRKTEVTGVNLAGCNIFDSTKPTGFSSIGFEAADGRKGGIFQNKTGKTIADMHLKLLRKNADGSNKDMFAAASTGGNAFPNVMISADMQEIWLAVNAGSEIMPDEYLWNFMTKLQPADNGGKAPYEGYLSQNLPKMPPKKVKEGGTCVGKSGSGQLGGESSLGSAAIHFDGMTLNFDTVGVDAVKYLDGSSGPSDAMFGAAMMVQPMEYEGFDPSIQAFRFSDSAIQITSDTGLFLSASLMDVIAYPDFDPMTGFTSVVQATVNFAMGDLTLGSQAIEEWFPEFGGQQDTLLFFRGNFIGFPDRGSTPEFLTGTHFGQELVSAPAPASAGLLIGLVGFAARRRRR